jgi:uncharacterized protein
MYGLLERDIEYIQKALNNLKEIDIAIIFGSRALGNYKKGSDVDIAISGRDITSETIYQLDELLNEEYPLPYFFDLLHYEQINNENLKKHIDTFGKSYTRKVKAILIVMSVLILKKNKNVVLDDVERHSSFGHLKPPFVKREQVRIYQN